MAMRTPSKLSPAASRSLDLWTWAVGGWFLVSLGLIFDWAELSDVPEIVAMVQRAPVPFALAGVLYAVGSVLILLHFGTWLDDAERAATGD